jgi:hypothetical protein
VAQRGEEVVELRDVAAHDVPNIAECVSTGLAGAIYGVILLLVIFVMPSGAAGFVRLVARQINKRQIAGTLAGRKK